MWIREAWGDFLAFVDVSALLVGVLVVDLSLYVSIFVAYIETLLDAELSFGYKVRAVGAVAVLFEVFFLCVFRLERFGMSCVWDAVSRLCDS